MISGRCPKCGRFLRLIQKEILCRCPECQTEYELAVDRDRWILKKPGTQAAESTGLVWFELQLAPTEFRLAVIPDQPVFFADTPSMNATQHTRVMLPNAAEDILAILSKFVYRDTGIFGLPMNDTEWAFTPQALQGPSFHLRMQSTSGEQWVSAYPLHLIPPPVWQLFELIRRYMYQILPKTPSIPVSDQVLHYQYAAQMYENAAAERGAITKVKVAGDGYIFVDGRPIGDWHDLDAAFDKLRQNEGVVWYYRESPAENDSLQIEQIAQAVIHKLTETQIPVRYFDEDFD